MNDYLIPLSCFSLSLMVLRARGYFTTISISLYFFLDNKTLLLHTIINMQIKIIVSPKFWEDSCVVKHQHPRLVKKHHDPVEFKLISKYAIYLEGIYWHH